MLALDCASAASPAKKVLILNSYHAGYKGSDDLVEGISEVLRRSVPSVDIKVEYLDSKNYSGPGYDAWVLDMLRLKYQGKQFDLLLSTDDYAFDLLEKHHDTVFKSVPLVFCGTNYFDRNRLKGRPHFVGVDEKPSFDDTIGLILSLHSDTRKIVAIYDSSETGRLNNKDFQEAASKYASRVEFSSLAGKPMEELLAAVGSLQPGTVAVYFASFVTDRNNARISSIDALRQIAGASRIPIYGGWEFTLGHGIVGGRLIDLREHGLAAGRLAVKILEGASATELSGVELSPNRFMFDYVQLQRFDIAMSKLPAGSVIINQPQTFFDKHGVILLSVLSAFLSIAVLIALAKLLISRRELERSRQKFATIFRASPDPIAILDPASGSTLEINDSFTRILGYTTAEVTGCTWTELGMWIAPEEQARMLAALGSGIRLENHETLFRKKGGEDVPVLLSLERQLIDQRDALLVTVRDITERKQTEAALQAREERFRALFDRASEGIVIVSSDGRLVAANESFAGMHGYTAQEIGKLRLQELDTPETLRLLPNRIQRILSGESLIFEVENYHKDGHVFPLEVSASMIVLDGEQMIQSFVRDISERKRAEVERIRGEQALRLAQEQMSLSQQIGHTGSWVYDLTTNTMSGSPEAHRIFGIFPISCDMSLDDIETCIPERERTHEALMALIREERKYDIEYAMKPMDGSPSRVVQAIARLEKDAQGNPVRVLGFIQDITERKRADSERASLEAKLRESQKMEALGTLAGGVAHDFNNALAAILGNVELARQDVGAGHAALVSLDEIGKASRRAKDLVQQILAFGRRQTLDRKPTSLSLVVIESARLIRATLPEDVTLNVVCKPDAPAVLADATQIKQILLNLCQNALHAVQGHGRPGAIGICLVGVRQMDPSDDLRPGHYACLAVRDNGAGMDEATRSHIFEPFFTTKPKGKGTGLGLSVVHGIAQAHEAIIEIDSALGKGSEFLIYFPACELPVLEESKSALSIALTHADSKHVLYVDDEEAIVFLMKRLLERRGYRVSGFTNPKEALAAVRADPEQYDIAVTDYNMPQMSGLEVAIALREMRSDLPVVLASGYITEELRKEAPAAGVRELIYKPDTVEELCDAVARFANAQSQEKPSS